ncbi:peptidylprolyl isomerase [Ponticoccus sp. SC2-23]|uniref:peptidylprolyl isomerase n=1 Tax=Alexandriicola marinus TaxID=2081710 RepID=UPI000FD6DCC8|nr:peptidylprolyl isomerase [Alexandriicola marinus]MBM1219097.1 peptidylprolyl isomerase [Ponticoccus sp. SC6-9]MBM1223831.1 peptidylprolyl isomerase [Ponticoccus sp. SC6-15]MBM1228911.1 peptidylprolyl isomerase [Ponticoccus sp. SC6-38]MBM1232797.1 peptidylprolyl isomerase [Ponticoccus sp. SC6-45]MBM1237253.1 peptidylprolyl isomerase [Ponticoccus sp. SC6-49]MBM1241808.1 peptidylprolyl isomerase [Ponticoccus sp. SC2-64]MBM1246321.1 peptidylprolyl isomerase [Ponticoccus sp. SC6-42]MBM1250799
MRLLRLPVLQLGLSLFLALAALPGQLPAQGLFSPIITVNDRAVSGWELDQRMRLLEAFGTQGDLGEIALEQLIEDRLKTAILERAGLRLSDEGIETAMRDFAARTNLSLEEFLQTLAQEGVAEETLRDYVVVGISWRDFVRLRFQDRVDISDAEVSAAIDRQAGGATEIEVLLSEIIIPAPPPEAAEARVTAERISRLTSTAAFSAEARRVSALPSREDGGRLDWVPVNNFPASLRQLILGLGTGEVTAPIAIPNGIALFQLRGIREVSRAAEPPAALEYAAYYIAGGRSEAGLRAAEAVRNRVDHCDDLYGVAQDQSPEVLDRDTLPLSEIPQDVALELAKLDRGEVSTALTRADGQTLVFLMLCDRIPAGGEEIDRETIRTQLVSQQLAGFADALLADERAAATIVRY